MPSTNCSRKELFSQSTSLRHLMESTSLSGKRSLAWRHMHPFLPSLISSVPAPSAATLLYHLLSILKFFKGHLMTPFSRMLSKQPYLLHGFTYHLDAGNLEICFWRQTSLITELTKYMSNPSTVGTTALLHIIFSFTRTSGIVSSLISLIDYILGFY